MSITAFLYSGFGGQPEFRSTKMKVIVLVTYFITQDGFVEGPICAFGLAVDASNDVWKLCEQFQLQRSLTEPVPTGYVGQVFNCELRPAWPADGYCFRQR
jgi:hypothetical protein